MRSTRFLVGQRLQLHVDRLSVGGRGVARHEGLVVFVEGAAPGDQLEVELAKVKKNFAEARIVRVVHSTDARIAPECPVAGVCGGCNWQHVHYQTQLEQKRLIVAEAIRKFSGFVEPNAFDVRPTVASPNAFRYRNRIQLHHAPGKDRARIGYFKRGTHAIVDIDDCPIAEQALADQISGLKLDLANAAPGRIELLVGQDGKAGTRSVLTPLPDQDKKESDDTATLSGPAFAQVNTAQNKNLVEHVLGLLQTERFERNSSFTIYDLYSGSGNFSLPIANRWPDTKVIAVELDSASVAHANANASPNVTFVAANVETYLRANPLPKDAVVVLDPPRSGCGTEVARLIAKCLPEMIVYISCHPVTLARDLKTFADAGYLLRTVQPVDMFPQTDHVETVVSLNRSRC